MCSVDRALPGCWSEGNSEEEALENIRDAIQAYLETVNEMTGGGEVREVNVAMSRLWWVGIWGDRGDALRTCLAG